MPQLEIKCPMCKGTLWIDQSTGKVIDHKTAEQQKVSFDSFMKQQESRNSRWEDKISKAKSDTARRRAEIEEKFKKARENPDAVEGEYESPFKWD